MARSSSGSDAAAGGARPGPGAGGATAMRLSVVVPCFNEEASVERLHTAVTAALAELTDV